jgi:chemotaxis protein MotB
MTTPFRRRQASSRSLQDGGEQDYWLSYSDLLAGLLMVFALILLVAHGYYQGRAKDVRDILEARQALIDELRTSLGGRKDLNVEVDSVTGVVTFAGELLFDEGSEQILPAGEDQLRRFAIGYLQVVLGNEEFREQLDAIVVEGHTNTNGSYLYNLGLSQGRAYNVMGILIENAGQYREDLESFVTANGRSFSRLVLVPGTQLPDMERSRRIEIRFRLKDEDVIREITERLFLSEGA